MSDVLLALRDLTLCTPERALIRDVGVTVRRGEITALVGPSGSGKSLTARAMMGVIAVRPGVTSGSLRFPQRTGERDWLAGVAAGGPAAHVALQRELAQLRGGYITYAPQAAASALNPGRTVGRQLAMAVARRDTPPADANEAMRQLLEEVGLPVRAAGVLPSSLSGGMAQRAAVAVALAPAPAILVADEPETGLDPLLRKRMVELLAEVAERRNAGLVLISHHMDTVKRVAHHVVDLGAQGGGSHD